MKTILQQIKEAVNLINWQSETKRKKALELCISIYNLYIYDNGDFYRFKSLSKEYFISIIKTKSYLYEIKDNLINNNILEVNNSYNIQTGKSKGYRFNSLLIKGEYVALSSPKINQPSISNPNNFNSSIIYNNLLSSRLYHICGPKLETYIHKGLQKVTFNEKVNDFIDNYDLKIEDILVNEQIELDYVNIQFEDDSYRYSINKAKELAKSLSRDIILYKEKCYIENVKDFLNRKTEELKLIFKKSIFEINNGIFRISRNETNRRLDYNLTNMKHELLNYINFDGEELIELDISNAQFAILSFITEDLDEEFIKLSKEGRLYNGDKPKWFRIAFDKIKVDHDDIRLKYPKTMMFIDDYKSNNGYKSFSNLLQSVESLIMIDGLLNRLIDLGYNVFTIHDAIRVKKSEVDIIKKEIEKYFKEIGFECNLRIK